MTEPRLSRRQRQVLWALSFGSSKSVRTIASDILAPTSSVSTALTRLYDYGYVEPQAWLGSARTWSITARGFDALQTGEEDSDV